MCLDILLPIFRLSRKSRQQLLIYRHCLSNWQTHCLVGDNFCSFNIVLTVRHCCKSI
nr:hypothetical protein Iba_scaffold11308.1CG0360 [Ipomoea batatas]